MVVLRRHDRLRRPRARATTSSAWLKDDPASATTISPTSPRSSTATPSAARGGLPAALAAVRADLRVKVALDKQRAARGPTRSCDLWRGADWLEREVLRHVRHHLHRAPRPAPHPDVGDLRRGLSAAEGLSRCAASSAAPSRPDRRSPPIPRRTTRWKSCPSPTRTTSCPPTCGERLARGERGES